MVMKVNGLAYPSIKADIDLCYKQLHEICQGKHGCAVMSVPPEPTDFDMQLLAAFDELKAYRATGLTPEEIPHWIAVSERLPIESEYRDKSTGELVPLLVCVKGTEYPFRAMYDGKSWGDGWSRIAVTHWMPLPAAPKEALNA